MPLLILKVSVLLSLEIVGSPSARSGVGFATSSGCQASSGRWVAEVTM